MEERSSVRILTLPTHDVAAGLSSQVFAYLNGGTKPETSYADATQIFCKMLGHVSPDDPGPVCLTGVKRTQIVRITEVTEFAQPQKSGPGQNQTP